MSGAEGTMSVLVTGLTFPRRRPALAVFLAVGALACDPPSAEIAAGAAEEEEQRKTVNLSAEVRNLESPGAFEVVNRGGAMDLAWEVEVEKAVDGEWRPIVVEQLELVERCGESKNSPCRTLEKGAVLRPVPWTGYSCSSQCNEACRANVYYGPGRFRFVVWDCPKRQRFEGPPFELPSDPPSR